MKISVSNLIVMMLVSSFLYTAKITSYSPVYVILPVLLFLAGLFLITSRKVVINISSFCAILYGLYLVVFTPLTGDLSDYINIVLAILVYLVCLLLTLTFRIDVKLSFDKALKYLIPIFSIEAIYRIINPQAPTEHMTSHLIEQGKSFYLYKFNSFMFADSNTTALALICLLFTKFALDYEGKIKIERRDKLIKIVLFILILLTFSRAAILATIFTFSVFYLRKYIFFLLIPLIYIIVNVLFSLVDESLASKFHILSVFQNYLISVDIFTLLFGNGIGKSVEVLGYPPHVLVVTSLIDIGIIGAIFSIVFFVAMILNDRVRVILLALPLAISSLSYFLYLATPFIFVCFAIIISHVIQNKNMS
ncbi:hypothetical protein AB4275_17960 [Vibrio cyclitrophicus]